jgi:hypothetical protein
MASSAAAATHGRHTGHAPGASVALQRDENVAVTEELQVRLGPHAASVPRIAAWLPKIAHCDHERLGVPYDP